MTSSGYDMARKLLLEDEAKRLFVYDDATGKPIVCGTTVAGNPTIGIGRNLAAKGITEFECNNMLLNDLVESWETAKNFAGGPVAFANLSPTRQAVLTCMAYNLGAAGLRQFRAFGAAVLSGDHDKAALEILASKAALMAPRRYERFASMWRNDTAPIEV